MARRPHKTARRVRGKTANLKAVSGARIHNAEIAALFNRYAVLLEIEGDNPFRVRAYRNAARTIENLPRDINQMLAEGFDLTELPGIGDDLAGKLADIAASGRFAAFDALKKRLPAGLADLTGVPGLGPKRIKMLFQKLKIKSVAQLGAAARAGRLRELPGIGPKIEQGIRQATEHHQTTERRLRLATAEQIAAPLVRYLQSIAGVEQVTIAGSFRRRKETVGDIDILAISAKGSPVIERFVAYGEVAEIIAEGTTRASVRLKSGLQVDLRVVPKRSYGAALLYFTGSKTHNIALRAMAVKRGLKFNEYGVFKGARWVAGYTEKDVYAKAGLPFIEPELRENQGELQAAQSGKLPQLITLGDLKGDLHTHTEASDGEATIEKMAEAARKCGYDYLAISDHAKHMGIVHGLDARRLAAQMKAIDRLNAKHRGLRLLKSAEVDILADGALALDAGILRELDFAITAIHSKFDLGVQQQTERLIRAMDHPCVNIIAHPSGRLIAEREPYQLDIKRLMRAAIERNCFLEVNAQPTRLDLSDAHCRMAKEMGLKLAISSDAHTTETLNYLRFGVDQARRGWLEPDDVINTRKLDALLRLFKR